MFVWEHSEADVLSLGGLAVRLAVRFGTRTASYGLSWSAGSGSTMQVVVPGLDPVSVDTAAFYSTMARNVLTAMYAFDVSILASAKSTTTAEL